MQAQETLRCFQCFREMLYYVKTELETVDCDIWWVKFLDYFSGWYEIPYGFFSPDNIGITNWGCGLPVIS